MATKGNTIFCTECGNGATLLDTYELVPVDDTCVIPETQTAWFHPERELIRSVALPTYGMCTELSRFYTFVNENLWSFIGSIGW